MTARFYYSPRTVALASHIVLEYVGADFEAIRLDFQANQQRSAEYLAINAKGRVPALVTERGVITETPAILLYLAQAYPQSALAPLADPFALAQLQAVNVWFCSTVHVANAHGSRGARWVDDAAAVQAMKAKVAPNMIECFDWIERELLRGPWMMGKDFSVADPYLFTVTLWLMQNGVDLARFPRVADHYQRMLALPAVQKIAPLHNL